jgi:4-hydroxyphenylpyruvate dioxygenase-like putative hemolysin
MTAQEGAQLHHVVFAVAPERHDAVAQMFAELGLTLQPAELTELGVRIHLDWERGIEIISPVAGSAAPVAASVAEFLDQKGDGVYTVVIRVPGAAAAESVAERHGARVRFRQKIEGDGSHLEEIDLSVFDLPLTLLDTNIR